MVSRAQKHMSKQLKYICKIFKVLLLEECKNGNKRYDFYIPTKRPIVVEVDGDNHNATKLDGFFFKTEEQLSNYKANDAERNREHKLGYISLFRFTDQEFPSIDELIEILGEESMEQLKNGNDENNYFYKQYMYKKRRGQWQKEKA